MRPRDESHPTEALSAYLDRELTAGEKADLEGHLAGCRTCATLLADLRRLAGATGEEAAPPIPRDFSARILSRLDESPIRAEPGRRPWYLRVPVAAAASLAALALLAVVWLQEPDLRKPETADPATVPGRSLGGEPERDRKTPPAGEAGEEPAPPPVEPGRRPAASPVTRDAPAGPPEEGTEDAGKPAAAPELRRVSSQTPQPPARTLREAPASARSAPGPAEEPAPSALQGEGGEVDAAADLEPQWAQGGREAAADARAPEEAAARAVAAGRVDRPDDAGVADADADSRLRKTVADRLEASFASGEVKTAAGYRLDDASGVRRLVVSGPYSLWLAEDGGLSLTAGAYTCSLPPPADRQAAERADTRATFEDAATAARSFAEAAAGASRPRPVPSLAGPPADAGREERSAEEEEGRDEPSLLILVEPTGDDTAGIRPLPAPEAGALRARLEALIRRHHAARLTRDCGPPPEPFR